MTTKSKKRDPARPGDWPVRLYPYMVERPYAPHPKYFPSHTAALSHLRKLLLDHKEALKLFDKDVPAAVDMALLQVGALPPTGGRIDHCVAPYTGTRFTATLVERKEL